MRASARRILKLEAAAVADAKGLPPELLHWLGQGPEVLPASSGPHPTEVEIPDHLQAWLRERTQ